MPDPWNPEIAARFEQIVGSAFVDTSTAALQLASTATFATNSRVAAIVKPGNRTEVQACLRTANASQVKVYPVSRGKNWGLGSAVPTSDHCVLLDLSRLDRILHFDDTLGYVTLESGVTFQQVYEYLRERNAHYFLSVTGGPPDGSVIGNLVERGDGAGPYGQRGDFVCAAEVVLPGGELIRTGFARFDGAEAAHVSRVGVGPQFGSLFNQSNLGVVTQLTVWLTPLPKYFQPFFCRINQESQLPAVLDAARDLLLNRVMEPNGFGIWNSYKYNASQSQYPWHATADKTPLDLADFGDAPWFAGGAIYAANEDIGFAQSGLVQKTIEPLVDQFLYMDSGDRDNVYLGVPTEQNIKSMYWRKRGPVPERIQPEADRCGVIWLCHALPLVGKQIADALADIQPRILQHGFEPNIGLNCISGRSAHLYTALLYDRERPGEDDRARACHDDVTAVLAQRGHLPYRLGLLSMQALPAANDDSAYLYHAIKNAIDPGQILAPGRYEL